MFLSPHTHTHTLSLYPLGALASCVNEGVVVVKYPYESTSLQKLLQMVSGRLKGRKALCIALIMEGKQDSIKICLQKVEKLMRHMHIISGQLARSCDVLTKSCD